MTRFRRTKDELARGLSPDEAKHERDLIDLDKRLAMDEDPDSATIASVKRGVEQAKARKFVPDPRKKGDIVIRIRPVKGVPADYFEHLRDGEIVVEQDEHWYKWVDHYLGKVYNEAGDAKFFRDILDRGIGELIKHVHFTKDIE